jgi:hypothetical protein
MLKRGGARQGNPQAELKTMFKRSTAPALLITPTLNWR